MKNILIHKLFTRLIIIVALLSICYSSYSSDFKTADQITAAMKNNNLHLYEYQRMNIATYSDNKITSRRILRIFLNSPNNHILNQTIITSSPQGLRGTIFIIQLSHNKLTNNFLYLPSNKRWISVKNSAHQSQNILNTDFTQTDFIPTDQTNEKFTRLADVSVHNIPCYVLQSKMLYSKKKDYAYKKLYISKKYLIPIFINFLDKQKKLVKAVWVTKAKLLPTHTSSGSNNKTCRPITIKAKSFKYSTESIASITELQVSNKPIVAINTSNRRIVVQNTNHLLKNNFGKKVTEYQSCL